MRRGVYSKKSFYRIQGAISLLRFLLNTVPYTVSTVGTVSALQYACHIDPHLTEPTCIIVHTVHMYLYVYTLVYTLYSYTTFHTHRHRYSMYTKLSGALLAHNILF